MIVHSYRRDSHINFGHEPDPNEYSAKDDSYHYDQIGYRKFLNPLPTYKCNLSENLLFSFLPSPSPNPLLKFPTNLYPLQPPSAPIGSSPHSPFIFLGVVATVLATYLIYEVTSDTPEMYQPAINGIASAINFQNGHFAIPSPVLKRPWLLQLYLDLMKSEEFGWAYEVYRQAKALDEDEANLNAATDLILKAGEKNFQNIKKLQIENKEQNETKYFFHKLISFEPFHNISTHADVKPFGQKKVGFKKGPKFMTQKKQTLLNNISSAIDDLKQLHDTFPYLGPLPNPIQADYICAIRANIRIALDILDNGTKTASKLDSPDKTTSYDILELQINLLKNAIEKTSVNLYYIDKLLKHMDKQRDPQYHSELNDTASHFKTALKKLEFAHSF